MSNKDDHRKSLNKAKSLFKEIIPLCDYFEIEIKGISALGEGVYKSYAFPPTKDSERRGAQRFTLKQINYVIDKRIKNDLQTYSYSRICFTASQKFNYASYCGNCTTFDKAIFNLGRTLHRKKFNKILSDNALNSI